MNLQKKKKRLKKKEQLIFRHKRRQRAAPTSRRSAGEENVDSYQNLCFWLQILHCFLFLKEKKTLKKKE